MKYYVQISAPVTESFMIGKALTDIKTLQGAVQCLSNEIVPNSPPVAASTKYRKDLAINLFYKVIITKWLYTITYLFSFT